MTCIVGIVDNLSTPRKVYMAADSGASDDSIILPIMDPKIQRNGKYLIGYAGETGLGQLLHSIDLPDPNGIPNKELTKFLRTKFCLAFKNAMNLYSPSTSPADDKDGGVLALIAVRGRLFEFDSTEFCPYFFIKSITKDHKNSRHIDILYRRYIFVICRY